MITSIRYSQTQANFLEKTFYQNSSWSLVRFGTEVLLQRPDIENTYLFYRESSTMATPRSANSTVGFIEQYCHAYRSLFEDVRTLKPSIF
ncbi:MAG: hypothetical protein BRC56_01110 [Cyanobacteria bacterium SW_9_47_5]|nr:MAG: hypothetical protein BRC56_01110 [Cyanobacteria bacterium SW_9_47_5]